MERPQDNPAGSVQSGPAARPSWESASGRQILEFLMGAQRFGLEITSMREVIPYQQPTPVFHTPDYLLGIINLRGEVLAVLDGAPFFDLPPSRVTARSRVLVLRVLIEDGERIAGFLVDAVTGARHVDFNRMFPPPSSLTGELRDLMTGVIEEDGRPLGILSAERLLRCERIATL